jgi:hypothetical protein
LVASLPFSECGSKQTKSAHKQTSPHPSDLFHVRPSHDVLTRGVLSILQGNMEMDIT